MVTSITATILPITKPTIVPTSLENKKKLSTIKKKYVTDVAGKLNIKVNDQNILYRRRWTTRHQIMMADNSFISLKWYLMIVVNISRLDICHGEHHPNKSLPKYESTYKRMFFAMVCYLLLLLDIFLISTFMQVYTYIADCTHRATTSF